MGAESCGECRSITGHKLGCTQGAGLIEIPVTVLRPVNPDCVQGKHRACAGDAWDVVRDEPTACGCGCHGEESPADSPCCDDGEVMPSGWLLELADYDEMMRRDSEVEAKRGSDRV